MCVFSCITCHVWRVHHISGGPPFGTSPTNSKKALEFSSAFFTNQRLPILPGGLPPSTFGVCGLNCCVRHGNRWIPAAIATELCYSGVGQVRRKRFTQFCVSSLTPSKLVLCLSYPDNCIKMFHTSNELSRIFPLVSESSFSLCICFQIHSLLRFGVSDSHMFVRRLSAPSNMALCLSQVLGLLVPVRSVHRCTSTPGLSTTSSLWDLTC